MNADANLLEKEEDVAEAVRAVRVVAVIGMKDGADPDAPAYRIPMMLAERGIRVIPVNPKYAEVEGRRSYAAIAEVPEPFDTVDLFRAPANVPRHVAEILSLPEDRRPRLVWMQTGIRHAEAASRLAATGIRVVQDRCLGVYASRYRSLAAGH